MEIELNEEEINLIITANKARIKSIETNEDKTEEYTLILLNQFLVNKMGEDSEASSE